MSLFELIIIFTMIALNGVFACYEMALASISRARLLVLKNQKRKGAAAASFMKERMEASLAVVQLGITLVGAVAAATGGASIDDSLAPYLVSTFNLSPKMAQMTALIFFVIPFSAGTIVFAELIPKMFAIHNREWVCLTLSPAMYWLSVVTGPVVLLFERTVKSLVDHIQRLFHRKQRTHPESSSHEFAAAVAMARTARLLGAREERIVLSASQFPARSISQILIPSADISMIPITTSLGEALIQAHLDLHTRFPVSAVDEDPQSIKGYITFKDLVVALKMDPAGARLESIVRPLKRFREDASIAQVLEFMIHDKVHIVLVETAQGQIQGMVTLEDIIEELVGDIEDEYDRLPGHVHRTAAGWIIGGGTHIDVVEAVSGVMLKNSHDTGKSLTFAEWCTLVLDRPLIKGETFCASGICVNVRKMRRRKLAESFVSLDKGKTAS